jgi:hypothetical protein
MATDMEKQDIHACGNSYLRITVSFGKYVSVSIISVS